MDSSIIVALIGAGVTVGNVLFTTLATRKQKLDKCTEQLEPGSRHWKMEGNHDNNRKNHS